MSADSDTTEKYLLESIRLAAENVRQRGGQPFGAVVTRGGELVATGFNVRLPGEDPYQAWHDMLAGRVGT